MTLKRPPFPPEVSEFPPDTWFVFIWHDGDRVIDAPWHADLYRIDHEGDPMRVLGSIFMFRCYARRYGRRMLRIRAMRGEIIRG